MQKVFFTKSDILSIFNIPNLEVLIQEIKKDYNARDVSLIKQTHFSLIYKLELQNKENYIVKVSKNIKDNTILKDAQLAPIGTKIAYKNGITVLFQPFYDGYPSDNSNLENIVNSIKTIHRTKGQKFGFIDDNLMGTFDSWQEYLSFNLIPHLNICFNEQKSIDSYDLGTILDLFSKYLPVCNIKEGVLCHGDLSNDNIICKNGCVQAIIDYENSVYGDEVFDIANWCSFIGREKYIDKFIDLYYSNKDRPENFYIRFWLYYLRIAICKSVVHFKNNKKDNSYRIQYAIKKLKEII